ncbi:MAG: Fic family protein [Candidatus Omnitrophica bacterium]|nr:Fic family protein [bacterium]MBU1864454.1 Fic family protein [Candidatus Omnitrophota bacterium]
MAFNPRYTITEKILNNLTTIATAREVIEQAHLIPKWEASLRRQAKLRNTHSSTAIEGNKLTLEQVEALADGKNVIATDKDKKEVLNYLEALDTLHSITEKGKIKVADLLNVHRMVSKDVLRDNKHSGAFRDRQVFVGKRVFDGTGFKEEVEYMPPNTEDVPALVKEFITWLNAQKTWKTNPVLLAGITHYEIARIHPFIDGNGRTARLFAALILYLSGFDHRRLFALDDFYDRDRPAYYAALKTAQENNNDITLWLEYFTTGMAYSVNEVKETVLKLGAKKKRVSKEQISLSEKQMKIVEFINTNGRVTNKDLQLLFDISAQAVHKELSKLLELKVIKSVGAGRSLHYILE